MKVPKSFIITAAETNNKLHPNGEICIVPLTDLCRRRRRRRHRRRHAGPTRFVQLRLLTQEQKCGIQSSSVQRGAAARTRRTAAAPGRCGRRTQSASVAPRNSTASLSTAGEVVANAAHFVRTAGDVRRPDRATAGGVLAPPQRERGCCRDAAPGSSRQV